MFNPVITIAREYASGGRHIGKQLAKEMGINYYDRKLLRLASDDSGINEALFGLSDEVPRKASLFRAVKKVYTGELIPPDSEGFTSNENLFNYQAKIIKELADTESCVLIGRCADFILKDRPNVLRVFIHAPMEYRMEIAKGYSPHMPDRDVKKLIQTNHKQRGAYYEYFTGSNWRDADHYDLSIDSSRFSREECVQIIKKGLELFLNVK